MYCPNCKKEFDSKFCPECGTRLIEKRQRVCPKCNIEVDSNFCPECGTKTVEVVEKIVKMCPNCNIESDSKFCPECGAKIVEMTVKATATGEIVAAGQQEDAETCYRTAQDYYYGKNGKNKDDEAAAQWYLKAAEQGHVESYYCLGNMLKEVCELEDAIGCFQEAAELGHAAAQYELGVAYSLGLGIEQNNEESMKWYRKAAEQGHEEAIGFLKELGERVPVADTNITEETKNNKPTESKKKETGKNEPRFCLKELLERITVIAVYVGTTDEVWAFDEDDYFGDIYTHWEAFCNCPQELQEKKMTKEEMSKFLNQRRGWDVLETVVKYAHYLDEGEHDWEAYEIDIDCLIYGNYEIQCRIDDELWLNVNWGAEKKFIDILCNFQVTDTCSGYELVDTMQIDYELIDRLVSVIENVASDSLPLHERFCCDDANDVFSYGNDANTMKELIKFAYAVSVGNTPKVGNDGLFEVSDDFNEECSYEITFPDADDYLCNWPEDFQDDEDEDDDDDECDEEDCCDDEEDSNDDGQTFEVVDGVAIIPEGTTEIGKKAFYECLSLKSVTIPESVEEIGECAFEGCESLKSVIIPESVKTLREFAFFHCISLECVVIPKGVKEIEYGVFSGCTSLTTITLAVGVNKISEFAFNDCSALTTIYVPAKNTDYYKKRLPEGLHKFITEIDS